MRAYWKDEHYAAVAAKVGELLKAGAFSNVVSAMPQAQLVLEESQRRDGKSLVYAATRIEKMLADTGIVSVAPSTKASAVIVTTPMLEEPAHSPAQATASVLVQPSLPTELNDVLQKHIAEHVAKFEKDYTTWVHAKVTAEVDKLCSDVVASVDATMEKKIEEEFYRRIEEAQSGVAEKPRCKVVILGLHAQQMEQIRQKFGEHLNLEFITSDESIHRFKAAALKADFVCTMRKFISHKHTNAVGKHNHKGFILVNGGLTDLSNSLQQLAGQEK